MRVEKSQQIGTVTSGGHPIPLRKQKEQITSNARPLFITIVCLTGASTLLADSAGAAVLSLPLPVHWIL